MEEWASGTLLGHEAIQAAERCQMAAELASLDDDFIAAFYRTNQVKEGAN
jgi:hypothetical protein